MVAGLTLKGTCNRTWSVTKLFNRFKHTLFLFGIHIPVTIDDVAYNGLADTGLNGNVLPCHTLHTVPAGFLYFFLYLTNSVIGIPVS